jgi:UDP-N-acetylglucosamine--N-acetylmuramyl-(pentapeptide) pyrophosphoryl-undecaprenol N-acetylglucosamine transferase
MAKSTTIMLAGGGTGGHVYPGLALAEALVALRPEVRIVWVGSSDRMEARVVPAAGHPFEPLTLGFLKGTSGMKRLSSLAKLPLAALRVLQLFARYRPAAVVGLGGYVAGPPCLIGALLGSPVFLLEQNAIPGRTNRFLARFCRRVFATFAQAAAYFPPGRVEVAGNPLRGCAFTIPNRN